MKFQNDLPPPPHSTFNLDFWFTMLVVGIEFLAICAYIIYFMADKAHPEDTDFGRSKFTRIIIFFGFLSSYLTMLMI